MSLELLIVERWNQEKHQEWIEDKTVNEVDEGAVVGRVIQLDDEVWDKNEEQTEDLYAYGEQDILSFAEERINQSYCKNVIQHKPDATVDDEFPYVFQFHTHHRRPVEALRQEHQEQARGREDTDEQSPVHAA